MDILAKFHNFIGNQRSYFVATVNKSVKILTANL